MTKLRYKKALPEKESPITQMGIKCLYCNKILTSEHRHDFRLCGCKNEAFIDGGFDYTRYGAMEMDKVELLERTLTKKGTKIISSEWKPVDISRNEC